MTRLAVALVLIALPARALADDADSATLGFSIMAGKLPVPRGPAGTAAIGLEVDHDLCAGLRLFGDYEWLWLARPTADPNRLERDDGSRAQLGLRHPIIDTRVADHALRLFVDGEAGGGLALASDRVTGMLILPHAFAGLRFGYDVHLRASGSEASGLEVAFVVRAIAVRDGVGVSGGMTLDWR